MPGRNPGPQPTSLAAPPTEKFSGADSYAGSGCNNFCVIAQEGRECRVVSMCMVVVMCSTGCCCDSSSHS